MKGVALAAAVGLVAVAAAAPRQTQAPPAAPTFRSAVDLVHLDVSVLDRDRRPVRDLTPADFTILENGQPQQILVFDAVDIPDPEPSGAPWIREVAPDVLSNAGLEERRLFLMILDDAAMQADLSAVNNVRDIARQVVDRLGPSDLTAVIFTRDNRSSQDYTTDRARLRAAIDQFSIGFRDLSPPESASGDDLYFMYSVDVMDRAVQLLSTMPDRRKSIIYIGQGVPVDLDMLAEAQLPGIADAKGVSAGASGISRQGQTQQLKNKMERVFQRAVLANVNLYTVDACGLRVEPPAAAFGAISRAPTCVPGLEVNYLKTLAANTGARAVTDTNDFEPGVTAIFAENASYYLLGYQSTNLQQDGKLRRIEVHVDRPDVEVRTRSGYQASKAETAARRTEAKASPLGAALSGVLPKSDLLLQMSAVAIALPGRPESAVAMTIGVRQPVRQAADRLVERVDLQVSAFNVEGKPFGYKRLRADVAVRAGATGLAEYEVLARLDLKPGRYQLRIAGSVGSLATSGSLYADVDVPNVSKAPVSLAGLVLSASPGLVVEPRDALRDILPVVPTTRRVFTDRDQVTAFARVYQGGKAPPAAVAVWVHLRDDGDRIVMERRQTIAADRFTSVRSADVRVDVPVEKLRAGEYLLTVEAGSGAATVRRHSRFHIGG